MNAQVVFNIVKSHIKTGDDIEDRLLVLGALEEVALKMGLVFEASEARDLADSLRSLEQRQLRFLYGGEGK